MSPEPRRQHLHSVPREAWELPMPEPPYSLVAPGRYVGVIVPESTPIKKQFGQPKIRFLFKLWPDAEAVGLGRPPLADRVPAWYTVDRTPTSRYAALVALAFPAGAPRPARSLVASDLDGVLLAVEAVTVTRSSWAGVLDAARHYSKVQRVLGRA